MNIRRLSIALAIVSGLVASGFGTSSAIFAQPSQLTPDEIEAITYMREEEKLARDVYLALYAKWKAPVFQNIARSEQSHMDAVQTLLSTYGVPDPALAMPGAFANPDLQALYTQLIERGSRSMADALHTGATIEDLDIFDLQIRLAKITHPDIAVAFANLEKGSRNHLRAFIRNLSRQGETYQPQYLDAGEYARIISAPMERGPATTWDRGA